MVRGLDTNEGQFRATRDLDLVAMSFFEMLNMQ